MYTLVAYTLVVCWFVNLVIKDLKLALEFSTKLIGVIIVEIIVAIPNVA